MSTASLELTESLANAMPLAAAASLFRSRDGRPVSLSTIARWQQRGLIGPDGARIYLDTILVGGRRMVTPAAVEEFLAAMNAGRRRRKRPVDDSARRAAEAGRALEAMGM